MGEQRDAATPDERAPGPDSPAGHGRVSAAVPTLVAALVGYYLAAMAVTVLPVVSEIALVRSAVVFPAITVVPGLLALLVVDRERETFDLRALAYTAGLSLVALLVVGFAVNLALPAVGVTDPLSLPYLAGGLTLLVGGLAAGVLVADRRRASSRRVTVPAAPRELLAPTPLALVLLPLVSILAVSYLDRFRDNAPLLVVLAVVSLVPIAVATGKVSERWHGLGIGSVALALIYHVNVSGGFWFVGNPDVIVASELQRWTPGTDSVTATSSELLTNTVLYPAYSVFTGLPILVELNVVNPFLVALIPFALYLTFRSFVPSRVAFLGATLFVFAHPFMRNYPTAGRAAGPVIFLALVGLVLSDSESPAVARSVLAVLFAAGIVVSHYGTTWFVMFAFLGALVLLAVYPVVDRLTGSAPASRSGSAVTDGGRLDATVSRIRDGEGPVFSLAFVSFFLTAAVGWYMFTIGGKRFEELVRHVQRAIETMVTASFFGEDTTTSGRVLKEYGTVSIQLSKAVYAVVGLLMVVGFAAAYYRRFHPDRESRVNDTYLAVATMMFGLFGSTFAFSGQWNGGRPMMISLTFAALFAATGGIELVRTVTARLPVSSASDPLATDGSGVTGGRLPRSTRWGASAFAVVLTVLLVLNTGIAAALVFGGTAPVTESIKFQQEDGEAFLGSSDLDLETHAWLLDNIEGEPPVYGDGVASGQTDWYRPMLVKRTETFMAFPYATNKPQDIFELEDEGVQPGFVLLLGHNLQTNMATAGETRYEERSLDAIRPDLDRRSVVYSNDRTRIYYAPPGSDERRAALDRTSESE